MKKINYKNLIILIVMGVASIGLIKDLIQLMNNATYTWFGIITALLNVIIVGKCIDKVRG